MIIRQIKENTAFSSKNIRHYSFAADTRNQMREAVVMVIFLYLLFCRANSLLFIIVEGLEFLIDSNHNDSNLRTIKVQQFPLNYCKYSWTKAFI